MKKLSLLLIAFTALVGCTPKEKAPDVGLASYSGLSAAIAGGDDIIIYDVRTAEEYESGHIPGALNMSHELIKKNFPVNDKSAVIVVYCTAGVRSGKTDRVLAKLGYTGIIDFGGITKWEGNLVKGGAPN
ncbi:MAG: rhodanese-like domain-containing protein [Spirochaetales bacterium]|jgi:phage shock protein E|nr:rhodanese-like domain-containing protein [Spirochaetales bacterium]